jgi:hypothetical protein
MGGSNPLIDAPDPLGNRELGYSLDSSQPFPFPLPGWERAWVRVASRWNPACFGPLTLPLSRAGEREVFADRIL